MAPAIPRNADHGADCYAEEQSHLVGTKCRHSFAERVNGPRPVRVKEGVFEGVESVFPIFVTCDVSKTKPPNFVTCGPIWTEPVPFIFVRRAQ